MKTLLVVEEVLMKKLHAYLAGNNPDLLIGLQGETQVTAYLTEKVKSIEPLLRELLQSNKPPYIIEEQCLRKMTEDLRPSRYNYIRSVFEDAFPTEFQKFLDNGILTYEIINLIEKCKPDFDSFQFSEDNEDDRMLRYAIIGNIKEYFGSSTSAEVK